MLNALTMRSFIFRIYTHTHPRARTSTKYPRRLRFSSLTPYCTPPYNRCAYIYIIYTYIYYMYTEKAIYLYKYIYIYLYMYMYMYIMAFSTTVPREKEAIKEYDFLSDCLFSFLLYNNNNIFNRVTVSRV